MVKQKNREPDEYFILLILESQHVVINKRDMQY